MTVLLAPFSGYLHAIDAVPDPVFAERMLGDGFAIDPLDGRLLSPADAIIVSVAPTGHSVTLRLDCGAEILIHVGLETVALEGQGFQPLVSAGEGVAAGQPLLIVDLECIAAHGRNLLTPIVIASGHVRLVDLAAPGPISAGTPLARLLPVPVEGHASSAGAATGPDTCRVDLDIAMAHGLHARPAGRIAAALKPFSADVQIHAADRQANARSPVSLMALGLKHGDRVSIKGNGADCRAAVEAVVALIESGMGEAGPPPVLATPRAVASSGTRLGGVKAAPGLAIGPAQRFQAADLSVPATGQGVAAESAALDAARSALRQQLSIAANGLAADLAAAHLALLDDPEIIAAARQQIAVGTSAAQAWRSASRKQEAAILDSGNALLAERAADLRDLERRLLALLAGHATPPLPVIAPGSILVADDLLPSEFQALMADGHLAGIATAGGGPTAHVAVLAASAGIPMLVAIGPALLSVPDGAMLLLDASAGIVDIAPSSAALDEALARSERAEAVRVAATAAAMTAAVMADGTRIEVFANLGSLADAHAAVALGAEGSGLVRTEFLFLDRHTAPDEAEQRAAYAAMAEAMPGRPLVFRTLDIGADKPVPYLSMPVEANPALGARGIRMAGSRPDLLETQLRALIGGVPEQQLHIMLPMVVEVAEVTPVRQLLDRLCAELGITARIPLGVMVETPAAALLAESLAEQADFLSIGTNDLSQYALAADRGNPAVAAMLDPFHPAVLHLIASAAAGASAHNRWLGVCGGMASDPEAVPLLIGLGVTELSVATAAIPDVKARVRMLDLARARSLAEQALRMDSASAVRALLQEYR